MNTEERLQEMFGKENPFKVPENYFESFTDKMMGQLPMREAKVVKMDFWKKYRAVAIAAACVCAVLFSAGVYIYSNDMEIDNAGSPLASTDQITETPVGSEDDFDMMADYVMIDNNDMYAYIAGE